MLKILQKIKERDRNIFTLKFKDADLEKDFLSYYLSSTITQSRVAIILACFAYLSFYFHDSILIPELDKATTFFRFFIILPIGILSYWFTYQDRFKKNGINYLTIATFAGSSMSIFFLIINPKDVHFLHYNDIMYILIFVFVVIKITFLNAVFVSFLLIVFFQITSIFLIGNTSEELLNANFYVFFSFIFAAVAGYSSEVLRRKEFIIRSQLIEHNKKTAEEAQSLEIVVHERTKELLKLNKALNKAKLKAEGSDRLKSAFLANISHEIRTPLTQIIGFSELLAKASLPQHKKDKYIEYLDKNSNRLLQIISDIIKLSEIESNQISVSRNELFLKKFLIEIEAFANEERRKQNKTNIKLTINYQSIDDDFTIYTDKNNLREVFINLISNAFKYTLEGEVGISYRIREDDYIEFCVSDTGKGIDEENTEIIFNHFTQEDGSTTRNFGGTGLGLSISKGIMQKIGGKIWVKSKPKVGSSFFFIIPYK
jgi:signal transduction histidine kinase